MRIYLIAIIKSKPQHTQSVKNKLENMVFQTRQEKACLHYDLHQSVDDPLQFVFYEIWESQKGLDLHHAQPYILDFTNHVSEMLECPPILYKSKLL